jgi:diphthamide synthase (EF-2-diphthine--ammonia ligase)
LPWPCSNDEYEARVLAVLADFRRRGVTHLAFGDLYLADVRDYRVRMLAGSSIEPLFPIWCSPEATGELATTMLAAGLGAVLTCVDPRQIDRQLVGRSFDEKLLEELPSGADRCGERGEFHTFCHRGPMFDRPIDVQVGESVERDGFVFADVEGMWG